MSGLLHSIRDEYTRYKAMAEAAMAQLRDDELGTADPSVSNSVSVIVWHLSGNLGSRFTDFLTTDGEKPWRGREEEFTRRSVSRAELMAKWEAGWRILFDALDHLAEADLSRTVMIRGTPFLVHEALHRSLAHASYHVGQIVYIAKHARSEAWHYLTIPPGRSETYNRDASCERPDAHAASLKPADGS